MKDGFVKVAAATPEIRVADTVYNTARITEAIQNAAKKQVKILAFPELCVTGYTSGDLFLTSPLLDGAERALLEIAKATGGLDMLVFVGVPMRIFGRLYNCAAAIYDGSVLALVPKCNVPNYGEFYEKRYFTEGSLDMDILEIPLGEETVLFGTKILFEHEKMRSLMTACEICEDLWVPAPPSISHAQNGATVIVNLSASDETVGKSEYRRMLVASQSARLVCGYIYANAGEGESTTDAVYMGHNMVYENGTQLAESEEPCGMIITEIDIERLANERLKLGTFRGEDGYTVVSWGGALSETKLTRRMERNPFVPESAAQRTERCEKILSIQSAGLRKRIQHTGAKKLVLGLSGGLDSTLALLVSARALADMDRPMTDIVAVTMPCFGTTQRTRSNAEQLALAIGAELRTVDITKSVRQHFEDIGHDESVHNVVYENSQARERTQVLMDVANGCVGLVVGTGDLSELALGWATYNGDHMSMYALNAGVPKTLVRYLVEYIADISENAQLGETLRSILSTPVSPELLPAENGEISQITEDLVGPYELHDFFLYYTARWGFSPDKIYRLAKYAFNGTYDAETISVWLKIFCRRFFTQQFKRSCMPDGPKVGSVSLSPRGDWRMPSDASGALWKLNF